MESKSQFRADGGFVEGVYLRIDENDADPADAETAAAAAPTTGLYLEKRCKVVRPDFVQAIDTHWMKQTLVKNTIRL